MKCSECTRRNSDDNQFCIYCGTALSPTVVAATQSKKSKKVVLPPQDIGELISDRDHTMSAQRQSAGVHPMTVIGLAIILGLSGVYYWFFYKDVYLIRAVAYETTNLINER